MPAKLFDSELKVMEVLWEGGDLTAGQLAKILGERTGWNRNTTYTVIKKLIDKGAIERLEPNFVCRATVTREQIRQCEAGELVDKLFDGSAELFLSSYVSGRNLSAAEIDGLRQLIDKLK